MKTTPLLALAAGLLLSTIPVMAHHSFAAEFDGNKPVTLTGAVTQVEWVNPHSWIHIDVKAEDGTVTNWALETAPPNMLYRQGWRRDTLKPGDVITVQGYAAKDGSHTIAARQVATPDGRKLFAGPGPEDNTTKQ